MLGDESIGQCSHSTQRKDHKGRHLLQCEIMTLKAFGLRQKCRDGISALVWN